MTTAGAQRHGAGRNSRGPPTLQERNLLFHTRSTGQAKQRIASKTPNLRPEVGLCLPVVGDGKMTSNLKCSSETRGNCTKLLFLLGAWGSVLHNLREVTLQFIPLIFCLSLCLLLSLNLFSRPSTTVPGRKLQRKEGKRKEGRKERERTKWKMDGCIIVWKFQRMNLECHVNNMKAFGMCMYNKCSLSVIEREQRKWQDGLHYSLGARSYFLE